MKTLLIIIFSLFSISVQAQPLNISITPTPIQEQALYKIPPSLGKLAGKYMQASYAAQKIVTKCARYNLQVRGYIMQQPEGEEPTTFDLLYVQTKVLAGLDSDAAEYINRTAYLTTDETIAIADNFVNNSPVTKVDPVSWCRIAAPKIVRNLLAPFNDTDDQETTPFSHFIVAKNSYLEAVRNLDLLARAR